MSKAISGSTGPIFIIFLPNGRYLRELSWSVPVFPIPQGTLPWQPILWQNYLPPALIALAFRNRMGYRYLNVRINSVNDAPISCKNFVNFGPVTPVNFLYDMAKTGVFSRISQDILDRFLWSFHHMKSLWVQMIDLYLVFRFVEGRCHDNQLILGNVINAVWYHLHSVQYHSKTSCNITV